MSSWSGGQDASQRAVKTHFSDWILGFFFLDIADEQVCLGALESSWISNINKRYKKDEARGRGA